MQVQLIVVEFFAGLHASAQPTLADISSEVIVRVGQQALMKQRVIKVLHFSAQKYTQAPWKNYELKINFVPKKESR